MQYYIPIKRRPRALPETPGSPTQDWQIKARLLRIRREQAIKQWLHSYGPRVGKITYE